MLQQTGVETLSAPRGQSVGFRPGAGLWRLAWSVPIFVALLGLAAGTRIGLAINGAIDPDESEHLHAAWLVSAGLVPYRDFWDHHAPLFFYAMAPLTRWLTDNPSVYLVGRALMLVAAAATLALLYRLARRLGPVAAGATTLAFVFLPRIVEKTTEVRPDGPALAAWLAAVLCVVRWRERRRGLWMAGLWLGLAVALNLKTLYGGVGLFLSVALAVRRGHVARPDGEGGAAGSSVASAVVSLASATLVVPAAVTGWLLWTGGWAGLGASARELGANLAFVDFGREWPVADAALGFLLLAVGGVTLVIRRHASGVLAHPLHGPLLLPTVSAAVILLVPTTPGVARHAWLPVMAGLSVYAGLAWEEMTRLGPGRVRPLLAVVAAVAVFVVPAVNAVQNALRPANDAQLALMQAMLDRACPGEAVLDGTALYVFRPAAYRYRVLINGVQGWLDRGVVREGEVLADVRAARPPVAYADSRVRRVPGVAAFVSDHYVPDPSGVEVLGVRVDVPAGRPSGHARVELLASGAYRVSAERTLHVSIDGAMINRGVVALAAGTHEVGWQGVGGRITLAALSCREPR